MDNLFAGMEDRVLSYVDDLAVFSKTWEEHKIHLQEVLDIIKKDGLTLRGDKCLIGADSWPTKWEMAGSNRCEKKSQPSLTSLNQKPRRMSEPGLD